MNKAYNSFHNTIDVQARPFQTFDGKNWNIGNPYISVTVTGFTYQFFNHFHPFVPNLIQNLNNGGLPLLFSSDVVYHPDVPGAQPSGQPMPFISGSTRAQLQVNTTGTLASGASDALLAYAPMTLPDATQLILPQNLQVLSISGVTSNLPADTPVTLSAGLIPIATSSGIQWTVGAQTFVVPDGSLVKISGATQVILTDGTLVTVPDQTMIYIKSGFPIPYYYQDFFAATYSPVVATAPPPYPAKELDFSTSGAYAMYNWEIFFHLPLMVAINLSQNQKFQDAQNWFHYIFNPTDNSDGPTPERFWRVKPLQQTDVETIQEILVNLSTTTDPQLLADTTASINAWKAAPFQPWIIAQYRPTAYMYKTVMAYLDNLIAWGDSLFQQYTIETINEATQLYILAANILGPKPQPVPGMGNVNTQTYAQLRGESLDAFSNVLADMETDIPFDLVPFPGPSSNPSGSEILPSVGQTLYFCIPQNAQLLAYWDTVANRLFNIHNSLNLQGVYQALPLYDPPIDPALLVRAAAEGLDVSAIVSGLNQPLPLVRFKFLIGKAVEICGSVQSLGAGILAAMEKGDNEALSLLRAQHESTVLNMAQMVKYAQWQDAIKTVQGVQQTLNTTTERYTYYQLLLGRSLSDVQTSLPMLSDLDQSGLDQFNFTQAVDEDNTEPTWSFDSIPVNISSNAPVSDGNIQTLSDHEVQELDLIIGAEVASAVASGLAATSAIVGAIPKTDAKTQPLGVGLTIGVSGIQLASILNSIGDVSRGVAEVCNSQATQTAKAGTYERRTQEWLNQSNLARGEMNQAYRQLRGAQIREAIASQDYQNHLAQIQQAQDIITFLEGQALAGTPIKETTVDFYAWMKRETKALYASSFQLAFEVAKKAERALQNELGDATLTYIQFNYLDGIEGLLAGEKLMLDIKTMEMAYHDLNQREYELTKHVSLLQIAPLALLQLKSSGSCLVTIPEELFDLDCPNHFFRRAKSIAITIPCVTGPYTSVNCSLTLQKSTIRTSTDVSQGYLRSGANDTRFNDYYGALQTIVTSNALSDSGLFETNLNDERYLPFEAVGVAGSQWMLSIPTDLPQFDYDTITDVILHMRYTAREGGQALKAAAVTNLKNVVKNAGMAGSVRLFSMRHEFPSQWAKFKSGAAPLYGLSFTLLAQHYPYWFQGLISSVTQIQMFAELGQGVAAPAGLTVSSKNDGTAQVPMSANPAYGSMLYADLKATFQNLPPATGALILYLTNNSMEDLWLVVTWSGH